MDNVEMNRAWQLVKNTGTHIFLTGKAGTGKTTFLRMLKDELPKRMVVLAPTGIAAINAGGVTIHSFFQLPFSPFIPSATFRRDGSNFRFGKEKLRIIRTTDLLVIDEISMVRADLLDAVDNVLRRYRDRNKPFGGVQLLMIGDLQQLPPVAKDEEWALLKQYYDSPYFFSSTALRQTEYVTLELKHVYRQSDASFLDLLNRIRENKADAETFRQLNRRYIPNFNPPKGEGYIQLTTHNHQAQQINDRELDALPGKAFSFRAEVSGNFPEQSYPTDEILTLKKDAQVMFVKNGASGTARYFNGMLGKVTAVSERGITVQSNETGTTFALSKEDWLNSRYVLDKDTQEITEAVEGTFRQYPLRLAWAVTIHKSQGLTFEHAIIDAQYSFAHGQTYVALSRCKTLEGLVLSAPLSASAVICDQKVSSFNARAAANQPDDEMLSVLEQKYMLTLLDELFDFRTVGMPFEKLFRFLLEHYQKKFPLLLTEYKVWRQQLDELVQTSVKFRLQYTRLLAEGDVDATQKRITAAATYFSAQLAGLEELFRKTGAQIGSEIKNSQFIERMLELKEALTFKHNILQYESRPETTFGVSDYLSQKAKILLNAMGAGAKSEPRKEKKPRQDTRLASYDLFQKGLSIAQIAQQRGLVASTVFNHLATFVSRGEIALDRLVDNDKQKEIVDVLKAHPGKEVSLTEVKSAVSAGIGYDEIKLVMSEYNKGSA